MKRALAAAVALVAAWAPLRARAGPPTSAGMPTEDDRVTAAPREKRERGALLCSWRVTNRGDRFVTEVSVRSPRPHLDQRSHPLPLRTGRYVSPKGWFETSTCGAIVWLGAEPGVVLAPGASAVFGVAYAGAPGKSLRCSELALEHASSPSRPPHVPPVPIALGIERLEAKRVPPAGPKSPEHVELNGALAFRNDGESDAVLDLGTIVGNQVIVPENVKFVLVDEAGHEYPFFHNQMPGAAGRMDPMDVPLQAHATYWLAGPWNAGNLPAGKYRAVASYSGVNGGLLNCDAPLSRKWTGRTEAKPVELVVP